MTTEEIKARKAAIEAAMLVMFNEFLTDTGMKIGYVDAGQVLANDGTGNYVHVEYKPKLTIQM